MTPLIAGQAKLQKRGGGLTLTICDERDNIPMGDVNFAGHGILHQVEMHDGITVPIVELVLRLITGDGERTYRAFVNELEDWVTEPLAKAEEITVILATPEGENIGTTPLANPFRDTANESLGVIAELVDTPWNGAQFEIARAYVLSKG
jgi:hypothetical protein